MYAYSLLLIVAWVALLAHPMAGFSPLRHDATRTRTRRHLGQHQAVSTPRTTTTRLFAHRQQRDIVVIGGGLAGLSAALSMAQLDPSRHVTVLDREDPRQDAESSTVASMAAAGMLAPQSERLPAGPLLDLCLSSRRLYPDFVAEVESLARQSGTDGHQHLVTAEQASDGDMEPWSVGYVASGGFLAPAFAGDAVATWAPPVDEDSGDGSPSALWLDSTQVHELEPHLHGDIIGGWWFPHDASVDARRLTRSLRAACVAAGVQLLQGPQYQVQSLDLADGTCHGLWLDNGGGTYMAAKAVLVANGAWMRNLLPVPVEPHKGQSLSLRMPHGSDHQGSPLLRRVLFAQDAYIVPKADGRLVVGATVEAGSYNPDVTPAGLLHILTKALQLVPALQDWAVEETWVGLRPTTPDKGPLLGKTPWQNLYLGAGYWRNGVLLAPKTGQLLASLICEQPLSESDAALLEAFAWDRFTSSQNDKRTQANARYAASMHPVHSRSSGAGVSAAVGTELGLYSTAREARAERQQDREALTDESQENAAFERAAALGKQDGAAYSFGEMAPKVENNDSMKAPPSWTQLLSQDSNDNDSDDLLKGEDATTSESEQSSPFPASGYMSSLSTSVDKSETASGDKQTQSSSLSWSSSESDLEDIYQSIRVNKARQQQQQATSSVLAEGNDLDNEDEERPDPGFRIFHRHSKTGQLREVPPYTSPGDFLDFIDEKDKASPPSSTVAAQSSTSHHASETRVVNGSDSSSWNDDSALSAATTSTAPTSSESSSDYSEQTYDGYQDIEAGRSREEELQAMREARRQNRMGMTEL